MKVVINRCFGGFGLSVEAIKRYHELKGNKIYFYKDNYTTNKLEFVENPNSKDLYFTFTSFLGNEITFPKSTKESGYWYDHHLERTDETLVQVVEELGNKANGTYSKLNIVEIPDGIDWYIHDYDGMESVEEQHRSWS